MTRTLRDGRRWYTSKAFWAGVGLGSVAALTERDEKAGVNDALVSGILDGLIFLALARGSRTVASSVRSARLARTPKNDEPENSRGRDQCSAG